MRLPLLAALVLVLIPGISYSQLVDRDQTLSVQLMDSPYVYLDRDGYVVATGEIINHDLLSATSQILLRALFYDHQDQIVEVVSGHPVLDTLPPGGMSPFVIKSATANPDIAYASVSVLSFDSSPTKPDNLVLSMETIQRHDQLLVRGTVENTGDAPSQETVVYLAFSDVFVRSGILDVAEIPIGDIPAGERAEFNFLGSPHYKATELSYFAESDIFGSAMKLATIPPHDQNPNIFVISDVSVRDSRDRSVSSVGAGDTIWVGSTLLFNTTMAYPVQPFAYYVQIKHSGETPYVEFIDTVHGVFGASETEAVAVEWTPESPGVYFIETFVWDSKMNPLASKGPVSIIMVN